LERVHLSPLFCEEVKMSTYLGDGFGSFGVLSNTKEIEKQIKYLEKAYGQLPETVGCTSEGTCCKVQHPHCYYIEFVYMMKHIAGTWDSERRVDLHIKCIGNYLSNDMEKQCIFLNKDMMCDIHKVRDYNCRSFGIIPEKAYEERSNKRKEEFKGESLSLCKQTDCCKNVRPEKFISQKKLDEIFKKIYNMDVEIGIDSESVDAVDNYLTFHDHYILHFYASSLEILKLLTELKENGSEDDKQELLKSMAESLGVKDE
jgi:Fe-S-cluster containining protein